MSVFDYLFMTKQLSDEGFNHCKSLLFPLLGYQYMTIEEVRRVDLCERINEFAKRYPMKPGQKKDMSFEAYTEVIENNIQNNIKCKNGSIANGYRNRALEIIKELKGEKDPQKKLEKCLTLFALYLGLVRAVYPDLTKEANDARLMVDVKDEDLLKQYKDYKFKNNNFLGIEPPVLFKKAGVLTLSDTDIVYIHNVLLYCILMEIQGEYKRG